MAKKYSKSYLDLQLKEVEEYVKEVKKRHSYLKTRLSNRYDKTDSLYNMSKDTIRVSSVINLTKIKRGKIDKATRQWIKQMKYYATTPVKLIVNDKIKERQIEFIHRLQEISSKEVRRAYYLLGKLTEEEKEEFFTSKYFFINTKPDSLAYAQFLTDNDRSVEVAKLEDFMKQKGYNIKSTFDKKVGEDDEEN